MGAAVLLVQGGYQGHPILLALAYTSSVVRPPIQKLLLILVALALIPLGASAQVACCSGMSSMGSMDMDGADSGCGDGKSCCERASDDAMARRCCEGGDNLDRLHSLARLFAVPLVVFQAAPDAGERALADVGWSLLPTAKPPDLVTLHAAFLI